MNYLILLIFLIQATICSAEVDSELELAKKYFSDTEIDNALRWTFKLGTAGAESDYKKVYKTEPTKFYSNKELTGEVIAEVDGKGLKIKDKYVCSFSRYSDSVSILSTQYTKRDHKVSGNRYFGEEEYTSGKPVFDQKIHDKSGRKTCDEFPVHIIGPPDRMDIDIKLRVFDSRVGRLKMNGKYVFFDVSNWIKKYTYIIDTDSILRRDLTAVEYDSFVKKNLEIRNIVMNGSLKEIYEFVYANRNESDDKGFAQIGWSAIKIKEGQHTQLFNVESKEDYLKLKLTDKIRISMIKRTFFKLYKIEENYVRVDIPGGKRFRIDPDDVSYGFEIIDSKTYIGAFRFFGNMEHE